ncbi:competence/damage-inducible protein A [Gorillibacterium massiliense]|uniref:competence/damage-inducible protein A n=1 Tax=Gorillibacterium massiliense TaxID=1280390 RepID=UPI0004B10B72|nr:competence/damage-inducible protein A [Gorillibacterium massiliense]
MKAELIAVGTELLLGQIVNSNAQFLSQQCAIHGIDVYFQTVVGDNPARLRQALEIARSRADLVLCTGGLGPTQDDLTKDVLADFLGKKLVVHEPSMDKITSWFKERGQVMVESNARQALLLEDSDALMNDNGMAVGLAMTDQGTRYMLLPGPPKEMKPMFLDHGLPWLKGVMGDKAPLYSIMLKFAGIGESALEHRLLDLISAQGEVTIAPYAKEGEVTIRLTTRARSQEEADRRMAGALVEIRERLGEHLFAEEDISIEEAVFRLLARRQATLSAAESCTGGLLSDLLTTLPGISAHFRGGVVSYSNELKHALLDVPLALLEGPGAPGAISPETARAMAEGMLKRAGTDYAVSATGVAGPDPSEGKPVGLVYFGIASKEAETEVIEARFSGNRETIKLKAVKSVLYHLWRRLK